MYPGISVKTSLQKYKDYTLLRLKFLVVRLVQSLAVTKGDVGGWGRDPRKQKEFCTTAQKQKINESGA